MSFTNLRAATAAAAVAALIGAASSASAQTTVDAGINVSVVSDYVFRGFSQTNEETALQAGFDMSAGSFYAGVWTSQVDFGDDTDWETDLYMGYRSDVAGFTVDAGLIGYGYFGAPAGADYDYAEAKLAVSRAVGPASVGVAAYYSPDFFGVDDEATYYEVNGAVTPFERLSLSGAYGKQQLDVSDDYTTWNVGLTYTLYERAGIDFRYHDTDVDGPLSDERYVASLKIVY